MTLRPELQAIVVALLEGTSPGDTIALDAVGEAVGARAIGQDEIDGILSALEAQGRKVASPPGGHGEASLKKVIATARALRQELDRAPRSDEIAARAQMPIGEVQHALALVRIMQR